MNRSALILCLAASSLAIAGCSKKAPEDIPPPPATDQVTSGTTGGSGGTAAAGVGTQEHFANAVNGRNVIYFDTDRYNIDSGDAAALQVQAQYLMQYPQLRVTIEGHCDERGTREYNLALGERRANAAKNYLVSLGIDPSRITTISYGKERPAAMGSGEASWSQNRRAVTVVIS